MDDEIITELSEDECWELLGNAELGRLAFHLLDEVHLVPVNFVAVDGALYFRTAEGNKLLATEINTDVAFEIDRLHRDSAESVVVRGYSKHLSDAEVDALSDLPLRSWVPTAKFNLVKITPTEITGRRFLLEAPWHDSTTG